MVSRRCRTYTYRLSRARPPNSLSCCSRLPNHLLNQQNSNLLMPDIVNIAAYKFAEVDRLDERRAELRTLCVNLDLKGTILLSHEGLNMFVAGSRESIDSLLEHVVADPLFKDIEVKESFSDQQPFNRMLVRIKNEIIAFGVEGIDPRQETSPRITAQELKRWYDEGKDFALLDVRNDYEVEIGTFQDAVPVGVDHFRDFPEAIKALPDELRDKPIVTFCTGGIRCEKAGPLMQREGFQNVYQLDGGILKYFEEIGGDHYDGDCFVFDQRVALDPKLQETPIKQCFACRSALTPEDQQSDLYVPGHSCPHCFQTPAESMAAVIESRHAEIHDIVAPLPGSVAYENRLPLNVPGRYDQQTLIQFLTGHFPHIDRQHWLDELTQGRIVSDAIRVNPDTIVSAGDRFEHIFPDTVEPSVNANIQIVHEDDAIVVVNKPAPLPMHPSGRFNRNTLVWILNQVYQPQQVRPAHRLDANTSGVVVLTKTRKFAARLQPQFESGDVRKQYLALIYGQLKEPNTVSEQPISNTPGPAGCRTIESGGLSAKTKFRQLEVFDDETSLVEAIPVTGRTNQIRLHLWDLGCPIVGDPVYLRNGELGEVQTVDVAAPTMCLHSAGIEFRHPLTEKQVTFEAPRPKWSGDL